MHNFLNNFKSQWSTIQTKLGADKEQLAPNSPAADDKKSSTDDEQQKQQTTTELMGNENEEKNEQMDDKLRPSQIANRVFGIAKKASSKLQEKATNISAIVSERTIIGNIEKERQKFMEELRKEGKCVGEVGLDGLLADVEAQQHIIAISSNPANLTEEPPLKFDLHSDIALVKQYAQHLFRLDPRLAMLRFELVPKQVSEEKFWRNYAYRISLVRKFVAEESTTGADQQQQQCSAREDGKGNCLEKDEKSAQLTITAVVDASPVNDDDEDKLEKELLNDLNEFEVVDEGRKKDGDDGAGCEDDDEKMGDELDKQLAELLDSNC